ncbi:MAG: hypothetical protein LBQ31_03970 [Bacteroidales bacterium]|jgi:tetratricopeptide (TPR) repeat protein|nr:hypothetical protein [Bacteroidales bacterium]
MKKIFLIFLLTVMAVFVAMAQDGGSLQLAQKYEQNGEIDKAISIYGDIFEKDQSPYVYEQYLNALLKDQRFEQAQKVIIQFQKKSSNPLLVQIDLGYLELLKERASASDEPTTGRKKKQQTQKISEKIFQGIINDIPQNVSPYILQECSQAFLQKTGRPEYSIKLYEKARKNSGNSSLFAEELGALYRQNGQAAEMMSEFIEVLKKDEKKQAQIEENIQVFIGTNPQKQQEIKKILQQQAQKEPQSKSVQSLYLWSLWQEKSFSEALKLSIEFSAKFYDKGEKIFETALLSAKSGDFTTGEKGFKYLIEHGEKSMIQKSKIALLDMYFVQIEKEQVNDLARLNTIKNEYLTLYNQMEKNTQALPTVRNLVRIYGYYLNQIDSAESLLYNVLSWTSIKPAEKAQVKLDLADILLYSGKVWDATLLYGQVEKDFKQDNIGFYAKLQNARLSYYIGEFAWAKSQLDVLKAATSKVIANDAMELSLLIKEHPSSDSSYYGLELFAKAEFLSYRKLYRQALKVLDTLINSPFEYDLFDNAFYKKAEIYVALDSVAAALVCLKRVYEGYSESLLTDDALFMAAEIYEKMPDVTDSEGVTGKERAMSLYEKIFMDYAESSLAVIARERYRLLRGDAHAREELPSQGMDPRPAM